MNALFGAPWDAPICEGATFVAVPVGQPCLYCTELIEDGDRGMMMPLMRPGNGMSLQPVHRECEFREVMGGWGHHEDHEYWCLSMHDPDGGLSRRESSLRVWQRFATVSG